MMGVATQEKAPSLFSSDLQAYSLFRIGIAALVLFDLFFNVHPLIPYFFSDTGYLPRVLVDQIENRIGFLSLLNMSGHPWVVGLFFFFYTVALFCLLIGYHTRIAKWVVMIGYISIVTRAPPTEAGAEMLIRLLLVWMLFVPLDRYWSVDAARRREQRSIDVPPLFAAVLKLQVSFLYFFAALFKLAGPAWLAGLGVEFSIHDGIYGNNLGRSVWLTMAPISHALNYAIIVFQLLFSALVYSPFFNTPLRIFALFGAFLMHMSFLLFLEVGIFPHICLVYLVLLIPDAWWNKIFARRRARLEKIVVYFDPGCGFCEKVSKILREFCLSPSTRVLPASDHAEAMQLLTTHNSWVVMDEETQKTYMKWEAVAFVLKQTPLFWPLGALYNLPFLRSPFTALYDCIGRNRSSLGKITAECLPWQDKPYKPTNFAKAICASLILLALTSNIIYLPWVERVWSPPRGLEWLISLSQQYQKWDLFAPSPTRSFYDYKIQGTRKDGTEVNLDKYFFNGLVARNDNLYLHFHSHRIGKFYHRLYSPKGQLIIPHILRKVSKDYNRKGVNRLNPIKKISLTLYHSPYMGATLTKPLGIFSVTEIDPEAKDTGP